MNAGERRRDFPLVLAGRDHDRIEVEAKLVRTFSDRSGTQETSARAAFLVTPDQRLSTDDHGLTCRERARLEALNRELRRLAEWARKRPPIPGPEPYILLDPASLAKARASFPRALLPFLNRVPSGATLFKRADGQTSFFVPPPRPHKLDHKALQHLELEASRIQRRLVEFENRLEAFGKAKPVQPPGKTKPGLPDFRLKPPKLFHAPFSLKRQNPDVLLKSSTSRKATERHTAPGAILDETKVRKSPQP